MKVSFFRIGKKIFIVCNISDPLMVIHTLMTVYKEHRKNKLEMLCDLSYDIKHRMMLHNETPSL